MPFQLAESADVAISIYNVSGQRVRTLVLGHRQEGIYTSKDKAAYWDGTDDLGEPAASGVYFYNIQADYFADTRKMVLAR